MEISLPDMVQFRQFAGHDTGWADHYGALLLAAGYCGIEPPGTHPPFPHIWQHGCTGPWTTRPEMINSHAPGALHKKIFVARKQEEEILHKAGFLGAKAIGIPIVYTPSVPVTRHNDTLLIMPQHTLVGMERGSQVQRQEYVDSLKPYLSSFKLVAACVSPSCIANGYFVNEFQKLGVDIIPGALTSDINAYLRMRCLMEQFETMTTNGWGSHVAYALYFGMKVSVHGPSMQIQTGELLKDTFWASFPAEQREEILSLEQKGASSFLEPFRKEPSDGIAEQDFGRWMVGENNKQKPEDLRLLFDWAN